MTLWRIHGIIRRSSTEQKLSERTDQTGTLIGGVKVQQNKEGTYESPTRLLCAVPHVLQTWLQPRHGMDTGVKVLKRNKYKKTPLKFPEYHL